MRHVPRLEIRLGDVVLSDGFLAVVIDDEVGSPIREIHRRGRATSAWADELKVEFEEVERALISRGMERI